MEVFTNHPAMKFCVPFIIGIVIGWEWTFSFTLVMILGLTGLTVLIFLKFLLGKNPVFGNPLIIFVVILTSGILKITVDAKSYSYHNVSQFIAPGRQIYIKGKVTDLPAVSAKIIRFGVEAESVAVYNRMFAASGGVIVLRHRDTLSLRIIDSMSYGREVTLSGELTLPGVARNPGEFDTREYLAMNDIFAQLYMGPTDSIGLGSEARSNFLATFVFPVRKSISTRLDRLIGGEEGSFLKGLIIGERSEISPEVKAAFINSGVMHIIAVSGLHVAIVILILIILLQFMRVPEKLRIGAVCILLVYYIFLTGAAASVTRSVIMGIVFVSARLIGRKTDVYNALALSAIILLMIDSRQLFQAGFQLSFVAVFALVYFYPKVYSLLEYFPETLKKNRIVVALFATLSVSLAAGIGTLPFTSFYFGKISLISFVANMVIVPLSNVILALGMLTVAVSYASTWLASLYAETTQLLTWILLWLVGFFGNLPFSYIPSHFSVWNSIEFYGIIAAVSNIGNRESRKLFFMLGLIVLNGWIIVSALFIPSRYVVKATFLDVGQGDALLLEFPDDKRMLVDAGPLANNSDAGQRFILPYLQRAGIHRLDAILLTHPHSDHLGGIPYLLEHVTVGEIIDAGSVARSFLQREYLHLIDSLKLPHMIVRAGTMLEGFDNLRLFVVHPPEQFVTADSTHYVNLNNQSVVIRMVYGQTSLLLAGDAEMEAEDEIRTRYGNFIHSDVLKAGHHGSITSSSPEFLEMVHPTIAVISVGVRNKFHHPSPLVLERFVESNCRYFRTDEFGAIILESDGSKWSVVNWRGS